MVNMYGNYAGDRLTHFIKINIQNHLTKYDIFSNIYSLIRLYV